LVRPLDLTADDHAGGEVGCGVVIVAGVFGDDLAQRSSDNLGHLEHGVGPEDGRRTLARGLGPLVQEADGCLTRRQIAGR